MYRVNLSLLETLSPPNQIITGVIQIDGPPRSLIEEALNLIQSLSPNPGQSLAANNTEYIVPDVFVRKTEDSWSVELNPDIAPRLRINSHYAGLVKRAKSSADNTASPINQRQLDQMPTPICRSTMPR